jgi:hypothetical protein
MESERPAGRAHQAPGPRMRARSDKARAEAVERLARWKRGIAAGAVVAFGAFIGLVGVAGARGASSPTGKPSSGSPPVTSQDDRADRSGGGRAESDDQEGTLSTAPDDGFFGSQDGGYGFGAGGSPSPPLGQSGAS